MTNDGHRSQGQTIIMPEGTWREVPPVTVAAASPPSCPARRWGLVVFVCGAAFATYGSLVPFDCDLSRKESIGEWIRAVPHRLSFDSGRVDFFSNVCLFIPVGLGGMAWLARNVRSARAVIPLVVVMLLALGLGLLN